MSPLDRLEEFLVDQILPERARLQYRTGNISHEILKPYADSVLRLSSAYTDHVAGERLVKQHLTSQDSQAYALYYSLINAAKVMHLLDLVSVGDGIDVLDVGCGPGTVGLALLARATSSFRLSAVEHSADMSSVAQRLLGAWQPHGQLESLVIASSLEQISSTQFDLITAANVLAEMEARAALNLAFTLYNRLKIGGTLVLIEPGQQPHTRNLMAIRDGIVGAFSDAVIRFPCTIQESCPMLIHSSNDWCHDTISWERPRLIEQFDDLLGFNKHRIKYSAIIVSKGGESANGYRVVSPPIKTARGIDVTLCGPGHYGPVRIRKGCRSSSNRALEKSTTYDRVLFPDGFTTDIGKETEITVAPDKAGALVR